MEKLRIVYFEINVLDPCCHSDHHMCAVCGTFINIIDQTVHDKTDHSHAGETAEHLKSDDTVHPGPRNANPLSTLSSFVSVRTCLLVKSRVPVWAQKIWSL